MIKRFLDVCLSLVLLVISSPVWLALAAWIKLDSPGPVFFRQVRVGRHGVPFRIHKFRTMRTAVASPGGLPLTVGHDARITAAGRWLRARRLDELPQLLDVLFGHMSLVGPRPEVPRYADQVAEPLRTQWLAMRPGLTDPASLANVDEAAALAQVADPERHYVAVLLPQKIAASLQYAQHATWWSDLMVMWRSASLLWR
jgi:lipopolysaccharide/colanic/teichoic acid biosynthesis glycosyltransferase